MRIFISYRRADSQATARAVKTILDQVPAVSDTFLDFDGIGPGQLFEERIESALSRCSHALILIGKGWIGRTEGTSESARIHDSNDFVRREVTGALHSDADLVPVLIDGVSMPRPEVLPTEIRILTAHNAVDLRTAHLESDVLNLLDRITGEKRGRAWLKGKLTPVGIIARLFAGFLAGAAALLIVAAGSNLTAGQNQCGALACRLRDFLGLESQADALGPLVMFSVIWLAMWSFFPFIVRAIRKR